MEKQTISVNEAAAQLGVSRNVVYRELQAGVIPSHRLGRRIVIPRRMFERWMAGEPVHTAAGEIQKGRVS